MAEHVPLALPERPRLTHNIVHFARALRAAGLPVGPGATLDAVRAVAAAGFTERQDFYWTLHAVFVRRREHREVFAQVFRLYWRDPRFLEQMMSYMIPAIRGVAEERKPTPAERRAAEALLDGVRRDLPDVAQDDEGAQVEIDASRTASAQERLRTLDFEQMSAAETHEARAAIARLSLPVRPIVSRRMRAAASGRRPDWPATMRRALRQGGEIQGFAMRRRTERWPDLVALCDISGSMSAYSRMVLHFLHAVSNARGAGWARVHAFTFGTRLTNVTRHMGTRDVDAALAATGAQAQDWEGGTRIGACLGAFNRDWSRRVMGRGAVVLLITDGLERGDATRLARETERLRLSSRRLIWLNPLLRWDGFAPRAAGARAMLPHVDSLRSAHSVASLSGLADALSRPEDGAEKGRLLGGAMTGR